MTSEKQTGLKLALGALVFSIILLVLLIQPASAACVAHWSMNNTGGLSDACSSTYTLTNTSADDGQSCVFNECYDFEKDSSWYMTDGDLDLASDYSICFWYKPESTGAVQGLVSKYSGVDLSTNYVVTLAANKSLRLFLTDGATLFFLYANKTIDAGNWYHICAWYDDGANTIGFWINNSRAGLDTGPGSVVTNAANAHIGRISAGAGSYADGLIDDIWILNSVVTSTEVQNLFLYGALTEPPLPVGCTVAHSAPANATFNTTSYNIFIGNAVCYQSMSDNCSLFVNGTVVYPLNTTMTNGTNFYINASVSNGVNQWHLSCTNGTFTNTTGLNWTLFIGANCTSGSTSTCNGSELAQWVWNYTSGKNLTWYNQTGIIACSNMTTPYDNWNYNGGRNVTSMDWTVFTNWALFGAQVQGYVWNATVRGLTTFGTLVTDIETAIWGSGTRTLTDYNQTGIAACSNMTTPGDNWNYFNRTLTEFNSTWANCTGGAAGNYTLNATANCSVTVDGCTRPIVLKTGDCS